MKVQPTKSSVAARVLCPRSACSWRSLLAPSHLSRFSSSVAQIPSSRDMADMEWIANTSMFFFSKDRVVPDWSDFMIHFCHVNLADLTRDQMIFLNRVENQISSNIYFKIPLGIPTGVHVSRGIPTGIFQINI